MPTPQQGETRSKFVSRCIPIVLDDGTAENQRQAVAVCFSIWNEKKDIDMSNSKTKRRQKAINRKEKRQQRAIDRIAENPVADSAFDQLSDEEAQAVLLAISEGLDDVDKEVIVEDEDKSPDSDLQTEIDELTQIVSKLADEIIELKDEEEVIEDPGPLAVIADKIGLKAITKREAGTNFSASDFADVPDTGKPSTWKLRLAEGRSGNFTVAQVARAITALQPSGFRGQRVKIGSSKATVIRKISGVINKTGGTDDQKRNLRERLARVKSTGFLVLKDLDDKFRWFGWVSNKWRDRDFIAHPKGEIISEAAHKEYVEYALANTKWMPQLWLWHTVGTAVEKRADFLDYADGSLVASGPLNEKEGVMLTGLADNYDLAMSHGFLKNHDRYDKENGIINQYRTFEASVLPRDFVANEWTDFETLMEVKDMGFTPERRKLLVEALGEEKVTDLEGSTKETSELLKALQVEFKDKEPEVKEEEAPEEKPEEESAEGKPAEVVNILNLGKELGLDKLSDYLEGQETKITEQSESLDALAELVVKLAKTDDEKIADALSPRMDVEKEIQPVWLRKLSSSEETLLTEDEEKKLDKATEEGVGWISDAMGQVAVPTGAVPK